MTWKTAFDFYNRRKEIHDYTRHQEDLFRMIRGFPDVNFRMVVEPLEHLTEKGAMPINATKEDLIKEQIQGAEAGLKAFSDFKASGDISNNEAIIKARHSR